MRISLASALVLIPLAHAQNLSSSKIAEFMGVHVQPDTANRVINSYINSTTCSGGIPGSVFTRFSGIFFGDFTLTGGQDILGPLAVQGTFTANSYTVNSNHGTGSCSDSMTDMSTYGLVVGGEVVGSDIHIHGSAFLPEGTDIDDVEILDTDCEAFTDQGTGLFDFDKTYRNAVYLQQIYSELSPTMKLNSDATLTTLSSPILGFDVFTFDTCLNGCTVNADSLSDPDVFLLGNGNWNGASGSSFPKNMIINIPVTVGSSVTLINNQPTAGIDPCRTIWNFYPVDSEGNYSPGKIEINRQTGGQLGGLILAPEANIVDGSTGNFAGLTIANNYMWQGAGVEMHDYNAIGGQCSGFLPCLPIFDDTPPIYPISPPDGHHTQSSFTPITPTIDRESESSTPTDTPSDSITHSHSHSHSESITEPTPTDTPSDSITHSHSHSHSDSITEPTPTESDCSESSTSTETPCEDEDNHHHHYHHHDEHHHYPPPLPYDHKPKKHHYHENEYNDHGCHDDSKWGNEDCEDDDSGYHKGHCNHEDEDCEDNDYYDNDYHGKKKYHSGSHHDGKKKHGKGGKHGEHKYDGYKDKKYHAQSLEQSSIGGEADFFSYEYGSTMTGAAVPISSDTKIGANAASKSSSATAASKTASGGSTTIFRGFETLVLSFAIAYLLR